MGAGFVLKFNQTRKVGTHPPDVSVRWMLEVKANGELAKENPFSTHRLKNQILVQFEVQHGFHGHVDLVAFG